MILYHMFVVFGCCILLIFLEVECATYHSLEWGGRLTFFGIKVPGFLSGYTPEI